LSLRGRERRGDEKGGTLSLPFVVLGWRSRGRSMAKMGNLNDRGFFLVWATSGGKEGKMGREIILGINCVCLVNSCRWIVRFSSEEGRSREEGGGISLIQQEEKNSGENWKEGKKKKFLVQEGRNCWGRGEEEPSGCLPVTYTGVARTKAPASGEFLAVFTWEEGLMDYQLPVEFCGRLDGGNSYGEGNSTRQTSEQGDALPQTLYSSALPPNLIG
jgi:hypothetical protein